MKVVPLLREGVQGNTYMTGSGRKMAFPYSVSSPKPLHPHMLACFAYLLSPWAFSNKLLLWYGGDTPTDGCPGTMVIFLGRPLKLYIGSLLGSLILSLKNLIPSYKSKTRGDIAFQRGRTKICEAGSHPGTNKYWTLAKTGAKPAMDRKWRKIGEKMNK